jgi:hypothetical protein
MRVVIQTAAGNAEDEPIARLLATTRTPPGVVWTPIRAARDRRDTALTRVGIWQPG